MHDLRTIVEMNLRACGQGYKPTPKILGPLQYHPMQPAADAMERSAYQIDVSNLMAHYARGGA